MLYTDGSYETTSFQLTNRYEGRGKMLEICKLNAETVVSAIHQDTQSGRYYVKRFHIETSTNDKKYSYLPESDHAKLIFVTAKPEPVVKLKYSKKSIDDEETSLAERIDVKGWKAVGNRLTDEKLRKVEMISFKEPVEEVPEEAAEEFTPKDPKDIPFEVVDTRKEEDDAQQGSLF